MKNDKYTRAWKDLLWLALLWAAAIAGILVLMKLQERRDAAAQEPVEVKSIPLEAAPSSGAAGILPAAVQEDPEDAAQAAALQLEPEEEELLKRIAMAEAEGEDTEGKALVMRVVLNRAASELSYFPDTIREVIYQDGAFTPVSSGRFDRVEPGEDCQAALELIEGGWDESQGATYFEATPAGSTWHSRNLETLFTHGNHTFYKEDEK